MSRGCARVRAKISEHLDGRLPLDEAAGLEAHLAGCPACRDRAVETARVRELLRAFVEEPDTELPLDRILGGVRAAYGEADRPARRRTALALAAAGLVAASLAAIAANVRGANERPPAVEGEAPRPVSTSPGETAGREQGTIDLTSRDASLLDAIERTFEPYPGTARVTRRGDRLEIAFEGPAGPAVNQVHLAARALVEGNRRRIPSIRAARIRQDGSSRGVIRGPAYRPGWTSLPASA